MKRKLLSFLLCLVLIFSFPIAVQARTVSLDNQTDNYSVWLFEPNGTSRLSLGYPLTKTFDGTGNTVFSSSSFNYIGYLVQRANIDYEEGDTFSFYFNQSLGRYTNGQFWAQYRVSHNGITEWVWDNEPCSFVNNQFKSNDFQFDYDCTIVAWRACISKAQYQNMLNDWTMSQACALNCTAAGYNLEKQNNSGLLNSIIGWLSDIKNNLVNKFNEIKNLVYDSFSDLSTWFDALTVNIRNFFTTLTDNVRTWFSNLTDNLRTWFLNVGTWFNSLGDRIRQFFVDIWSNFTNWWDSLWNVSDGYFDNWKQDWETWARAHFGLFYDVKDMFDMLFSIFAEFSENSGQIVIPAISLPFLNNPLILQETVFNFNDLINGHSMILYVYNTYKLLLSGIAYFLLIRYALNVFEKLIGERNSE